VDTLTIPEAARIAGVSPREVRVHIEEGRLRASQVGGQRVIETGELERAGLVGDKPEAPMEAQPVPEAMEVSPAHEATPTLVERLETQAAELAVLRRASAERRTNDERERRRLEEELAEARRELQAAHARIAELETAGFTRSLERRKSRPALGPLFERTPEEPSAD
jgi:excisionase family DNA binding protein